MAQQGPFTSELSPTPAGANTPRSIHSRASLCGVWRRWAEDAAAKDGLLFDIVMPFLTRPV